MKTIKLFYTILITFLCNTYLVQAQQIYIPPDSNWISPIHKSCMGKIVSTEHEQLVSNFTLDVVCYFIDTTSIDSMLWKLPEGWSITLSNDSIMPVYLMNDSLVLSFTVSIPDTGNLPFYPQYMELELLTNKQDSNSQVVTIAGKIYFTPYNSIEIWSLEDFYNQKRYWLEKDTIERQRIYIPRDSIPLSDLTDPSLYERDSATWDHWWIDNFREIEVEGLAYTILMSPVPFDSLEYYYDIYDIDNIDTSAPMQKSGNIFTGIISGRLTANIENDLKSYASITEIGLAGLRVCLLDKDGLFYENFGEAYTDEDGYFQIPYVKTQTVLEGEKVELYIRVFSETNSSYTVQSRNFWGVYKSDFYIGKCDQGAGAITINPKITTDKADAFRATHWVRKGIKYFNDQNVSCMSGGLKIKINCLGSYANVYIGQPKLHIGTGDADQENIVYHEFGHYTMYRLQNKNMLIPYGNQGVNIHSPSKENTGLLAWIEGWAGAMQMILDAAYWQEDNEYGLDELGHMYENLIKFSNNNINNGFRSEYHIALAIYDLWDGPNKGLPGRIPYFNIHGWNDSEIETKLPYSYYSWKSKDDIELTFAQICAPLQTISIYADLNGLRNIGHYYRKLISQFSNCELISDINRTFRENRLLWDISEYEKGWNLGNLHLDSSFQNVTVNENGYFYQAEIDGYPINLIWYNWDDIYSINSLNEDNVNKNIIINNTFISPCILKDNYWLGIYEENVVDRSTNLILSGEFHTCGENEIIAKKGDVEINNGSLTINKNSLLQINLHGELNIDNATLRIASGGTLYLKNGSYTILSNNSSIIIEEGGYICVEDGAEINLYDANSTIELLGGALHGLNPILKISSTQCQSICDYPTNGNGEVQCKCIPYTHETLTISSNCSYIGSNHIILNELIIENNAIATFTNSTLNFYNNALITIHPGSKLIIDGSTLTNACNGELWQGIFVEGDPFDSTQSQSLQGVVELKNGARIENAICAINVGFERLGPTPEGCVLGGGIVKADNVSFINNLKAVEFGPYHRHKMVGTVPLTRNASSFSFCHFMVNDNALFDLNDFEEHVNLVEVDEIGFHSCNFSSTNNKGTAIQTVIAGSFILDNLGDIFNPVRSSVSGFDNAISIKDGKSTTILNTDFNDNNTAVLVEGADNLTIGGNGFYIPYESYYGPTTGVSLTNTPQFKINNNLFQGVYNCNYGLIINHSGGNDNVVKNNEFSSLRIAALAYGKNSDGEDGYKGLQYHCNKFENNDYDIVVSDFDTDTGSIRFNQGDKNKACGNIFTVNGNSLTSPNYDFQYHFKSNSPEEIPINFSSNIKTVAENNHQCNQIGVENPTIAPDNPPIDWNDELVNDYEIVAASLETSKSIYVDNGYDNIPIDWNTYFNTVPIPIELEEQVRLYYEICNLQFQVSDICQTAIFYIQSDSLLDTGLYHDWLIRTHTPEADYLLAESYYENGNQDECFDIINAIPEAYESYDENENQNYLLYYDLREYLRTNGMAWSDLVLGTVEMVTLNNIAESGINGAAVKARAIESAFDFLTPCRDDIISKYILIDLCMYIVNTNNDNFLIPIEDPFEDSKQDNITTSINETTDKEHHLTIYPNPASTLLTIDNGNQMMQKISLCDVLGREIKTFTINASKTDLTITDLSNGFYFLRIQTDKGMVNKRFVKE